ncbi:MAG: shikimate dehydrogenase [Bacteroidia bacterium]|jgi:shikimate dehydrogenase
MTKDFGIIGNPVQHSFSPEYFNDKFQKLKLPYTYHGFELKKIKELEAVIQQYPNLFGLNVTSPYKEDIMSYLSTMSPEAMEVGAVNTVVIKGDKLHGFNTDVDGFDKVVEDLHVGRKGCLVLGTGGASKAVIHVLESRDMSYVQVSRSPKKNMIGYSDINQEMLSEYPVIINTTPLGMMNDIYSKPQLPYRFIGPQHVLVDLVYQPRTTAFLQEGLKRGARIKNGYQMLIEQAEAAWKIWSS